ncbi:hypothetical protein Bbelb_118360 [Branchiostoma belcheri]|nr:hypothetical protein Bbelb_118360 [Branchiostoma belcheri]
MASLPEETQKALDSIVGWGESYSLGVNGKKTMDMVFSARKEANVPVPPHPTIADYFQIQRTTSFKLLGVHIAATLTWDVHVHYMVKKSRSRVYYLSAAKKVGLPTEALIQIYLTFIRPLLEYASPVCVCGGGGLPKYLSDMLEAVQHRCMRIIGIPKDALPSLSSRRDTATLRTLQNILQDSSSPLNEFLIPPCVNRYCLRREGRFRATKSRTKRHELSFVSKALKLYYHSSNGFYNTSMSGGSDFSGAGQRSPGSGKGGPLSGGSGVPRAGTAGPREREQPVPRAGRVVVGRGGDSTGVSDPYTADFRCRMENN